MTRILPNIAAALFMVAAAGACNDEPLTLSRGASELAPQANQSGGPNDIAEIQQIVNTFDAAWTAGDYATYAAQYAGAEFVGPNGAVLTDPAAITGLYQFVFTVVFPGTTRQSTIRNLTFLTGTVAVLNIDTQVTGFTTLPPGVVPWAPGIVRAREKNVLQKRGGEWQIIQHQQTIVAPGVA